MAKNKLIGTDIEYEKLASLTKNYTGSEIEAVCTSVKNFVLKEDADAQLLGR
jgi:vesicle-fusing ATPase